MKSAKMILSVAAAVAMFGSAAIAQQARSGSITRIDEANGMMTIQPTPSGTVGSSAAETAEDFKVQDGLVFNALQVGDKVTFTAADNGGVKTITKIQKQ